MFFSTAEAVMQRAHRQIPCKIEYVGVQNDFVGRSVPGVIATCSRCRHQTDSIGTSVRSLRECLRMMSDECPCGGSNDYGVEAMMPALSLSLGCDSIAVEHRNEPWARR